MLTTIQQLTQRFHQAIQSAFPEADIAASQVEITPSTQEKFGHYQCNSAMKLRGLLKKNPREIAQAMLEKLAKNGLIAQVEIAGPGFINITLDAHYLAAQIKTLLTPSLGITKITPPPRVIIDFSSPNTAKEMHVGHLRSTIIGDCLARLFEFLGYDVLRLNHVGDWGTAFGMLIAHMKDTAHAVLLGTEQTDLTHLVKWYRESKKRFDEDPEFKQRAQKEVVAIQNGDATSLRGLGLFCNISR